MPLPGNAGYLLAVSTIGEVKLFCLRNPKRLGSEVLRVQRIAIPAAITLKKAESESDSEDSDDEEAVELAEEGARHLQFTPDGKWLLIITPDSRILMANLEIFIQSDLRGKPQVSISSPVYELDRGLPPTQLQPASVVRTPSKKRFRQRQDEGTHSTYMHTIVKSAFSSTSRLLAIGDLTGNISTFSLSDGTWTRIVTSIPRLPAAPVVLSFRPAPTTLQISSSSLPKSDDDGDSAPDSELLVLPADTHIIHLFSATSGRLAQWSQRNPMPDCLPIEFAAVGDRAVGAFWEGTERVWCFGATWVWMFDFTREWPNHKLSFDTQQTQEVGVGKRKRSGATAPVGVGSLSGAGSRMHHPMGLVSVAKTDDSEDEEDELAALMESDDETDVAEPVKKQRGQKPYWGSYRYRSLLGFLPVGKREVVEMAGEGWGEQGLQAIEMVVVERPVWDVGLPPRFFDGKS